MKLANPIKIPVKASTTSNRFFRNTILAVGLAYILFVLIFQCMSMDNHQLILLSLFGFNTNEISGCTYEYTPIKSLKELNEQCVLNYHAHCTMEYAQSILYQHINTSQTINMSLKYINNLTYFIVGHHGGVQIDILSFLHYKLNIPT
eukprot:434665_1